MKFRKKPVVIEAEQFISEEHPWPFGVEADCDPKRECSWWLRGPHVHTLEGPLAVSEGDWVITGVRGERYPCKPDIFEATYEAVE